MFVKKLSTFALFSTFKQINYYKILDLSPTSSIQVIKKRYYELAKKYHPDATSDPEDIKKFVKINQAYQTLSDFRKKKLYDESYDFKDNDETLEKHKNKKQHARRQNQYAQPWNDVDQFFKKSGRWGKPKRGEDIYEKVSISLQEAVKGLNKKFKIQRTHICIDCDPESLPRCFACGGKGTVHIYESQKDQKCKKCKGKGYKNNCETCFGEGSVSEKFEQQIYIQKGVANQTVLRKQGAGGYGVRHKNGDLYIKVQVQKDDYYVVDGNNVKTTNYIPISTAVLGGNVNIETLHGVVQLKIQAGTQSGDQKRLPNYGIPSSYSNRMGDHIISFRIKIPTTPSQQQKVIYKNLHSINI